MSAFKPGDKVWVEATVAEDHGVSHGALTIAVKCYFSSVNVVTKRDYIHCDPTEELERLRAFVENEYCYCYAINPCARCKALGKERP